MKAPVKATGFFCPVCGVNRRKGEECHGSAPINYEQAEQRMKARQQYLRRKITEAQEDPERYHDHGDLELSDQEREFLRECHFEPWGSGGWVRFAPDGSEQGGTCYDDKWAMSEALALTSDGSAA